MDLNNKSAIGLLMDSGHMAALNLLNTTSAVATATAVLPQLAEAAAKGIASSMPSIALGVEEGISVLADGNLRIISKLKVLVDRKPGESAAAFFERCCEEERKEEVKEEKKELPSSSIGFNKDGSF